MRAGLVFASNLLWENAHGFLYDTAPLPGWRYLRAAVGDVLLVEVGREASRPVHRRRVAAGPSTTAGTLTLVAVAVELHALRRRRWSYTRSMPTVASVGVSPLVQLPATALASDWLAQRLIDVNTAIVADHG